MEENMAYSAVYTMFSTLMQPPERSTYNEIIAGRPVELWDAVPVHNGRKPCVPESWLPENFPSFKEWRAIYNQAMPPARPLLVPVESVHKVWTTDPSCEMPFARETGLLQGDPAHHLFQLYKDIGFELPLRYADSPDHLVLELEFMGVLVEEAEPSVQYTFLTQHLDWLPTVIAEAERKPVPELYLELLRWVEAFLVLERARLSSATG